MTAVLASRARAGKPAGTNAAPARADTCACLAYRYLAAVDIEGFSKLNALEQMETQADLGWVLDFAADRADLCRAMWHRQVRGDGELAILPADTDGPRLIADYPRELAGALGAVNKERRRRLRIRVAMHHGTLAQGQFGAVGQGPIVVSRLLDSDELRKYLAQRAELDVALIVSACLFHDVIETRFHRLEPAEFTRTDVRVKGTSYPAYIHRTDSCQGLAS